MANHGYVKTRKVMSAEAITRILNELNENRFKSGFQISHSKGNKDTWTLSYPSKDGKFSFGNRVCWLNTKRSFEMRHGGGTDFIWWADGLILHTLATRFNGRVSDDGVGGSWPGTPDEIDTFVKYMQKHWEHIQDVNIKKYIIDSMLGIIPDEFYNELSESCK